VVARVDEEGRVKRCALRLLGLFNVKIEPTKVLSLTIPPTVLARAEEVVG
jgi:hypothetical protein